jgi:hypothetical protein
VLQLDWTAGGDNVWSASADKSVGFWDAVTGQRVRKMADHSNIVNAGSFYSHLTPFVAKRCACRLQSPHFFSVL